MPALLLDVTYTPLSCRNNPRHVIRKIVLGARPENLEIMRNGDNLQARRLVEYWDQSGIPTTLYLDDKCDRCLQKHKEIFLRAAMAAWSVPRLGDRDFSIRAALGRPPILPEDVKRHAMVPKDPPAMLPSDSRPMQHRLPIQPAPVLQMPLAQQWVPAGPTVHLGRHQVPPGPNLYYHQQQVPAGLSAHHHEQQQVATGPNAQYHHHQRVATYAEIAARGNVGQRPSGALNKTSSKLNPSAAVFAPKRPQVPSVGIPPKCFVPPTTPVTFPREPVKKAVPKENNSGVEKSVTFAENMTVGGGWVEKEAERDIDGYW